MNKLSAERRTQVIQALVEGNSIRATCRMTGVAKGTVLKLLADMGEVCTTMHRLRVQKLQTKKVQIDEIWSFCYSKAKNVPDEYANRVGFGDVWTFTAIDADSKLNIGWLVGERNVFYARRFLADVANRLASRVQVTTDGHKMYGNAVPGAFGYDVDFATLHKIYSTDYNHNVRYSPPVITGTRPVWICGNPVKEDVSTSFVERANLTMRMSMRRFTRLTNAFSKKVENHAHAVALHFAYYNWCRAHKTLTKSARGVPTTPAMAAGLTDKVWEIGDLVALLSQPKIVPAKLPMAS